MPGEQSADQVWKALLNGQWNWDKERKRFALLPGTHRCKNCNAPFDGIGAWLARLAGRGRFNRNPRFCNY